MLGEILASWSSVFTETKSASLAHLGFAAGAGHPALQEAEGPAHFVLLRLNLRWDYVSIPLLIFNPGFVFGRKKSNFHTRQTRNQHLNSACNTLSRK